MSSTKSHALVLGASGLVGFHTTKLLLAQNDFELVYAVSRKGIPLKHERLRQIIADYDSIDSHIKDLEINHLFSCLGSTKSKTPNKTEYIQVDHDYPVKVAKELKEQGTQKLSLVSALGADKDAKTFYMQLKGRTEQSLSEIDFDEMYIMQPSLIVGDRKESRLLEGIASFIFKCINPLLVGNLKKYRSIHAEQIASALVRTARLGLRGSHKFHTQQIKDLS